MIIGPLEIRRAEKFMNTIAANWVASEDRRNEYQSMGIDFNIWPPSPARAVLEKYTLFAKEFSPARGFAEIKSDVAIFDILETIPTERKELFDKYDLNLKLLRSYHLINRLKESPYDYELILADAKKNVSNVKIYNLKDEFVSLWGEVESEIYSGTMQTVIKDWEILSRLIGGFNPGRVSMLVAETGVGKTMVALNLAMSASKTMGVLFFNMEMVIKDMVTRFAQAGAGIKYSDLLSVQAYESQRHKIENFYDTLKQNKSIHMSNGRALGVGELTSNIMALAEKDDVRFVVVDYDQRINHHGHDEEWRQLQIAVEDLEEVAKATNTHIMLLCQGNEGGQVKASKRSVQPASTVFEFAEDDGIYLLRSKKNRFGVRGWELQLNCDPSMSFVSEAQILERKANRPWATKRGDKNE